MGFGGGIVRNAAWVSPNTLRMYLITIDHWLVFILFYFPRLPSTFVVIRGVSISPFYASRVMSVYKKILKGNVQFPSSTSRHARNVISRLLVVDRTQRLGCGRGGGKDVEAHPFFKAVDFAAVQQLRVKIICVVVITQRY